MMLPTSLKSKIIERLNRLLSHEKLNQPDSSFYANRLAIDNIPNPYNQFNVAHEQVNTRDDIVFVSSRYRSGSTLLWNIFRQLPNCTSYYEPFNERRWFDSNTRGDITDSTHRGVQDYWAEYNNLSELSDSYNPDWIHKNLLMDASFWDPKMRTYIDTLIEHSPNMPVLQFNRVDFRLPWLRHHYPNSKIVHLYRHPREVWCSFLTDKKLMNKNAVMDTYQDAFYLDVWCRDLAKHFPVLDIRHTPHPYQRFYYLWKLSYLVGTQWSNCQLSFEQLVSQPMEALTDMFSCLNISNGDIGSLLELIQPPASNGWKKYADDDWFNQHEQLCENNLSLMLGHEI
jgi:hypothetical protein